MFVSKRTIKELREYEKTLEKFTGIIKKVVAGMNSMHKRLSMLEQIIAERGKKSGNVLLILKPDGIEIVGQEIMKDIFLS